MVSHGFTMMPNKGNIGFALKTMPGGPGVFLIEGRAGC